MTLEILEDFDSSSPGWAFEDIIKLNRVDGGSTVYFQGRIARLPDSAAGGDEYRAFTVAGPWFDLQQITFQQSIATRDGASTVAEFTPRVALGQNTSGIAVSTGTTITEILSYADSKGANLNVGTIPTGIVVTPSQADSVSCADAIRQMLRYHPDWVAEIDYSGATPVFNIRDKGTLAATTLDLDTVDVQSISITPRPDRVPSFVRIVYHRQDEVDGQTYRGPSVVDKYPSGATSEMRAINTVINLSGGSATTQEQRVKVRDLPAPAVLYVSGEWVENSNFSGEVTDVAAWKVEVKARVKESNPWLSRLDDSKWGVLYEQFGQSVSNPENTDDFPDLDLDSSPDNDPVVSGIYDDNDDRILEKELIEGQLAPWMEEGGEPIKEGMVELRAIVYWSQSGEKQHNDVISFFPKLVTDEVSGNVYRTREVTFRVRGTNARSKTYRQTVSYTAAETPPTGIAQAVYESLEDLQYEGSVTMLSDEVTLTFKMGQKLKIANGRSEWATMGYSGNGVPIQTVSSDINAGTTTIGFGPPGHLSPADFRELLRFIRTNPVSYVSTAERTTGEQGDNQPLSVSGYNVSEERGGAPLAIPPHPFQVLVTKYLDGTYQATVEAGVIWIDNDANGLIALTPTLGGTLLNATSTPKEAVTTSDVVCYIEITVNASTCRVSGATVNFGASLPSNTSTVRNILIANLSVGSSPIGVTNVIHDSFYYATGATGRLLVDIKFPTGNPSSDATQTLMEHTNGLVVTPKGDENFDVYDMSDYEEQTIEYTVCVAVVEGTDCIDLTFECRSLTVLARGIESTVSTTPVSVSKCGGSSGP